MAITKNATKLNRKANQCQVTEVAPGLYDVLSPSGRTYRVDLNRGGVCNCQWGRRGAGCSHEMAARKAHAAKYDGRRVSFQRGASQHQVARKQHKSVAGVAENRTGAVVQVLRERTYND